MTSTAPRATARGVIAIVLAMSAWVGFSLSTRAIGTASLSALDVDVIRYAVPALLLAPWWRRAWREARQVGWRRCLLIAIGGGTPFFLVTALGAELSSAGHVPLVNLGATPVLIALVHAAWGRRRPTRVAAAGLIAITLGIALAALGTPGGREGVLVLLGSAALWTTLTLAQERTSLLPMSVVVILSVPSALASLLLVGGA